jgi:hypothetical protein
LVVSVFVFDGLAMGQPILGPEDTAIAIDVDGLVPVVSSYPGGENPPKIIDGDPAAPATYTKYLNNGGAGSGFIVSPLLPVAPESFTLRVANDASGRDPASWELYGFNGPLVSTDNSTGNAEAWVPIGSGSTGLNADAAMNPRNSLLAPIDIPSNPGYEHYKMLFPTLRTAGSLFQAAEVQFYDGNDGMGTGLLNPTDPIKAINNRLAPNSRTPGAETAPRGIDRMPSTKYLNFGEERSGIIITNAQGPVRVNFMRLTTASDAVERDPTSFELYGTNDAIQSAQHSNGLGGEQWTLIRSGTISLPGILPNGPNPPDDARFDGSTIVAINSPADYRSYKLIFPTVKDAAMANSMQIADIQFATTINQIPEPSTVLLVALGIACTAAARRRD